MRVARHFLISGRVQGVGYRYFAKDAADREGVTGWVRNLPDGSVETLVEGDAAAVEGYLDRLRRGPSASRVDGVVVEEKAEEGHSTFEITR